MSVLKNNMFGIITKGWKRFTRQKWMMGKVESGVPRDGTV